MKGKLNAAIRYGNHCRKTGTRSYKFVFKFPICITFGPLPFSIIYKAVFAIA